MMFNAILITGEDAALIAVYAVILVSVSVSVGTEEVWRINDRAAALADVFLFHAGMIALMMRSIKKKD